MPATSVTSPVRTSPAEIPTRDSVRIWDVPFDRVDNEAAVTRVEQLIEGDVPRYIITANLNYVMLHHCDASVRKITDGASLIVADGQPIVWRSRLTPKPLPCRVAGSEWIVQLAERAAMRRWPIYFLGGQPGVADAASKRLQQQFPDLIIAGVESPPFRELSAAEADAQRDRIAGSGAKMLWVAFGQPKGERWIAENYQSLGIPVSIQLGASFDFLAGQTPRAPDWMGRFGLEWLHRIGTDPRRLIPRYAANARFLAGAMVRDWKLQVSRWGMNPMDR